MTTICSYYRKCSGCTKLQFPYIKQVRDKELLVRDALAAFAPSGGPVFMPLIASPLPLGYRSSTKLCLGSDTFGKRSFGLYEYGTKHVVDIPGCPVHHPDINRLAARLFGPKAAVPAPFYNHAKRSFQPGCLKFATVRVSPEGGGAGVVVSHTGVERNTLSEWARRIGHPSLSIYEAFLTKSDDDQVIGERVSHLGGPADVRFVIAGLEFRISPVAFFQANFALTDAFVRHITADLRGDTLLDLYGGFGAYSVHAARNFRQIFLVDTNKAAIAAAAATAGLHKMSHLRGEPTTAEQFLGERLTPKDAKSVTHIIVNPTRAGLSPKFKAAFAKANFPGLKGMTYVSCNPETLARDLEGLTRGGRLKVRSIQPFDMFPQTDHVEVVVKLST